MVKFTSCAAHLHQHTEPSGVTIECVDKRTNEVLWIMEPCAKHLPQYLNSTVAHSKLIVRIVETKTENEWW